MVVVAEVPLRSARRSSLETFCRETRYGLRMNSTNFVGMAVFRFVDVYGSTHPSWTGRVRFLDIHQLVADLLLGKGGKGLQQKCDGDVGKKALQAKRDAFQSGNVGCTRLGRIEGLKPVGVAFELEKRRR